MPQWMHTLAYSSLAVSLLVPVCQAGDHKVNISENLESVTVQHGKEKVTVKIQRNQDPKNIIKAPYNKTSRACPPFCITPIKTGDVETVAELEVLDYLDKINKGDKNTLVVDSRTPEWLARGTIPGSINVPWLQISPRDAAPFEVEEIANFEKIMTDTFGASKKVDGSWDFSQAKTLVMFCNGLWCPQSLHNIRTLISHGYPSNKLKWYRGGMQDWINLGLTTMPLN